jgi:hypothetical protein
MAAAVSAAVFYDGAAEIAECSNTFTTGTTPTDPAAVTLVITDPAGIVTTYNWPGGPNTLTHGTAGVFSQGVPCSSTVARGDIWQGVWTGTGAASDVQPFTWTVWPVTLNQYYCSAEELKSRLKIVGTADDSEIALAVAAASRAIDGYCDRYFFRGIDTRTYVPDDLYNVCTDDFVSVTTLATDPAGTAAQGSSFPVTWAATDYQPWPYNPGNLGEPWPYTKIKAVGSKTFTWVIPQLLMRQDRVQLTAVYGWPAVPQAVRTAALILAEDLLKMKDAPFGVAGVSELGPLRVGDNPMMGQLLAPYLRHPFLAA